MIGGLTDPVIVLAALTGLMLVDGTLLLGVLVPGDLVVITASAALGWPTVLMSAATATAALVVAHTASYLVGRRYAGRLRTSRVGLGVGFARWCRAEQVLGAGGDRALVAIPFIPVVNVVLPALAGSLGVRPARYLRLALLGGALWVAVFTGVGAAASVVTAGAAGHQGSVLVSLGVSLVAILASALVLRRSHQRCGPPPEEPVSVIV